MMKFSIKREALLKPLQLVTGVVERKQTKPILSHVLLVAEDKLLTFIGTDLEVELHALINMETPVKTPSQITLPGKKFLDICRSLPENSTVELTENKGRITLSCGRSRFTMTSLPTQDFPRSPEQKTVMNFRIKQGDLRQLIEKTSFAIPQQDVRQYLNGLLFEVKDGTIQTLATDGHRLAVHSIAAPVIDSSLAQVIIPRKGVFELLRLLEDSDEEIAVSFNNNIVNIKGKNFVLISKLISGKFPNYNKIIPKRGEKRVEINCNDLKQALMRVAILSNELFRSVHFKLRQNTLVLTTNNPEQEEAVEELSIDYKGENLDIIFNVGYFVDILNVLETEKINLFFKKGDSGIVIEEVNSNPNCLYVLMPIRQ
ncbi:MAG: DNA polymerase III subunit beta [Gammaproteobacteria bacterium]|nr:DNA polymerase III subunit beta [Gammaproteobacteria bacterium]